MKTSVETLDSEVQHMLTTFRASGKSVESSVNARSFKNSCWQLNWGLFSGNKRNIIGETDHPLLWDVRFIDAVNISRMVFALQNTVEYLREERKGF